VSASRRDPTIYRLKLFNCFADSPRGGGPDRHRLGPHQCGDSNGSLKEIAQNLAGSRFDAASQRCPLVRRLRLLSDSCSSARTFASRFLQTPPRGDSPLRITNPSPPSGCVEEFHLRAIEHSHKTLCWRKQDSNPRFLSVSRADGRARSSGKVHDTHSVGAIRNHNLGAFTVTEIVVKNTAAVPPAHRLPRTPKAAYSGLQRCRAPSLPLTCLARLAAWQSLCTGHIDALLKTHRLGLHRPDPLQRKITDTSARPRERLACLATARPSRKHGRTRKRFLRLT
jgi:hypothetical protein